MLKNNQKRQTKIERQEIQKKQQNNNNNNNNNKTQTLGKIKRRVRGI